MSRPCPHPDGPPHPADCRVCYLFVTNKEYNLAYGGDGNVQQPPNLLEKATHFGIAVIKHIVDNMKRVPLEVLEKRKAICHACNYYNSKDDVCEHPACGCGVERKAMWRSENCPWGKWGDGWTSETGEPKQQNG